MALGWTLPRLAQTNSMADTQLRQKLHMDCWRLRDACFEPDASSDHFRLHVASENASELLSTVCQFRSVILHPLRSSTLRHLQRDIVRVTDRSRLPRFPLVDDELTLLWVRWEQGYSDSLGGFMLPLAERAARKRLPTRLAVSGLRHPTLAERLRSLAPGVCASERANPPVLPRCSAACYKEVRVCSMPMYSSNPWRAMAAIDQRWLGMPAPLPTEPLAQRSFTVIFGQRWGRAGRRIVNLAELVSACNHTAVALPGVGAAAVKLACRMLPESTPPATKAREIRKAQAFVSMYGGETINALHLPYGGSVVQIFNEAFVETKPPQWVRDQEYYIMGGTSRRGKQPLRYYSVVMSANRTQWEPKCAEWVRRQRAHSSATRIEQLRQLYDKCNGHRANMTADWPSLRRTLERVVRDQRLSAGDWQRGASDVRQQSPVGRGRGVDPSSWQTR